MWTFCHVRLRGFKNFPTEWVLRIDSLSQLVEYDQLVSKSKAEDAFHNEVETVGGTKKHYTNKLAHLCHTIGAKMKVGEIWFLYPCPGICGLLDGL